MRSVFKKIKDFIWALFIICPALFILPIILLFAYLVAASDLPGWFKFFLLG